MLVLPVFASCGLVEKGTHNAGKNCMWPGCHGYEAPTWTYAGTVFTAADRATGEKGDTVKIVDSSGEIRLTSNSAGNFSTSKGNPSGSYRASVSDGKETRTMSSTPTSGACNSCHTPDGDVAPLHTANR